MSTTRSHPAAWGTIPSYADAQEVDAGPLLHRRPTVLVATVGVGLALGGCGRGATSLPASAPSTSGAGGATTSVRASADTATA